LVNKVASICTVAFFALFLVMCSIRVYHVFQYNNNTATRISVAEKNQDPLVVRQQLDALVAQAEQKWLDSRIYLSFLQVRR
jgi:hypothetical protein